MKLRAILPISLTKGIERKFSIFLNKGKFDGHIVLTDMEAPKPVPSKCQRIWFTTENCAKNPYFQTNEKVIGIPI